MVELAAQPGGTSVRRRPLRRAPALPTWLAKTIMAVTGLLFTGFVVARYVIDKGISAGLFWCQRDAFEAIGGFDERMVSVEDVDFAVRLKALGKTRGQRFGTLWRGGIITSCRKFDHFGDWYLVRNPAMVRRMFDGHDRRAADQYWYDVER